MRDAPSCSCAVQDRRIPSFLLDNVVRRIVQPPRRFLARHIRPGDTAADLGCGPGHFTVPMARVVGDGGRVVAVDFDEGAVARLRRRAASKRVERVIQTHVASAAEVDFIETASIDFVLAEGLLCCMADHDGALRQIERVLRPTGLAWLSVMKGGRRTDPRSVSKAEWHQILSRLRVVDSGEGIFSRWALVGPRRSTPAQRAAADPGRS